MKKIKWIIYGVFISAVIFITTNAYAFCPDFHPGMWLFPVFGITKLLFGILWGIISIGIWYLSSVLMPKRIEVAVATAETRPIASFFMGTLGIFLGTIGAIGLFIFAILSIITIIGIPVGLLIFLSMAAIPVLAVILGPVPVVILLGRRLKNALNLKINFQYSEIIIGGIAYVLIMLIPIAGWLISAVVTVAGIGSFIFSKFGKEVPAASVVKQPVSPENESFISQENQEIKSSLKYDSLAMPALVCGILAVIPVIGIIFALLAVIFGVKAIRRIDKSPESLSGRTSAMTGFILGLVFFIFWLVCIIAGIAGFMMWQHFANSGIFGQILDKIN